MKIFKKFLTPLSAGIIMVIFFIIIDPRSIYRYVDAFQLSAFILFGISILIYISSLGGFDLIAFWSKKFASRFKKNIDCPKSYYDYKLLHEDDQKPILWPSFVVSLILFTIGTLIYLLMDK